MNKTRTYPYAVCVDPVDERLHNVQGPDTYVVFRPGVSHGIAIQTWEALNKAWAANAPKGTEAW